MADESSVGICGGKSKPKINFFPQVDTTPEMSYEISERELFRCLVSDKTAKEIGETQDNETSKILKDINLKSKITQVETHKSQNVGQIESENIFIVFHTTSEEDGGHWWSLEESAKSVTMQRSHEETAVKNKFEGKHRCQVVPIAERLQGKGWIKDFFILLWIHSVMDLKCQSFLSRCESFIPLVMKELTQTYYEYPSNYFTYSALSSEEINPQLEEIVNLLTKVTKWHPLLCLTYLGDIQRFNQVLGKGFLKNKIDGIYNKLTLLNSAILFNKKEMVQHLLEKKKANARIRDKAGRNALNMAALFTDEEEIIKLLLIFTIKVDACDKSGMTALHYAVISSNLTVARHLIDQGADFKRLDPTGHSPLHLAAHYAKDSQILDLLLTKVEIDECDSDGITALHSAAIASNAVSTCYLIERGADTNHRDISGRTPVHVAAAFAKNVDFFKIFLSNEKADLECCDERKLNVLAYAKINQFGLAKEIVSGIEKKINDKRSKYSLAKKTADVQPCTGDEYEQKLMIFVPDADNKPEDKHEISEAAIFRFLLNEETHLGKFDEAAEVEIAKMFDVLKDIDKESKITQVEAYRNSMNPVTDEVKAYHVFIVFKSTSEKADDGVYWWSLEKHTEYIVLQRSRNKDNVKDKLHGKERIKVKSIKEDLKGKGTIKDLFEIIWAHQVIPEKYNIFYSNCQSFVTFVSKQITEIGYKYKGNFKYYPPRESGRDKQMLDLINILRGCSDWSPLFTLIPMGNTDLVDKTVASGKYDINASCKEMTPLHLAIKLNKTKMVQHLLQPPMNADPTKRDASGKSALLWAVSMSRMKPEIIDLLLQHGKINVDDVDENGQTALHLAIVVSNVVAVEKLLEKGANPDITDKWGQSPLHLAAQERNGNEIMDLLLAHSHSKVKVDDLDGKGRTALHIAVYASNVNVVKHLINKGANPNAVDQSGDSLLLVAGMGSNRKYGNPIIDLLLEAQKVKGIGDINDQIKEGRTALHYAAAYSNEITAEHLIKKGANINCRTNVGDTPLHYAALGAEEMKIIDLLLQNINEGDIQQYKNNQRLFFFARHNLYGLGNTILDRLVEKNIKPPCNETDDCTGESDEATGVNTRRFVDKGADPSIDLTGFDGLDFLIARVKKSLEIDKILKEEQFDINSRNKDGETLLLIAILGNNVNAVRRLLEIGADPTIRDNDGDTLIHVAVFNYTDFDILNLLLESEKVDINETAPRFGMTALHMAIKRSNTVTAEFLLSKGANPNITDKDGWTPLHLVAMYAKDMEIVELLLNHPDVDVNLMDNKGRNALDEAKENIHGLGERISNLLKEKGTVGRENTLPKRNKESLEKLVNYTSSNAADEIESVLSDATVPIEDKIARIKEEHLISAIQESDVESVSVLLKNGADISSARGKYGENALHVASYWAKTTDLIDVILETGKFDINVVDNDGDTPLHYAMKGSNSTTNARHLIQFGGDPNIIDQNGITPFHLVAKNEETAELIDIILKTGQCNINGVDNYGRTPLHYAIERFIPATINVHRLITKGADPGIADKNGVTPLHMAARNAEKMDLIEVLLNTEAVDVNFVDNQGRTPLVCARDNKHGLGQRIIARLKEYDDEKKYVSLSIKFEKDAILGMGAYGVIFKGEWNNLQVAVKRFELSECEAYKQEDALRELDHPNVVKLYHVESDLDFRYHVLELCQLSLHQLFQGNEEQKKYREKMPPEKEVCLQLAKGLVYIHENRLIHRDIKPENVLIWVDYTGEKVVMKWSGFGLSKHVNERGSYSISGVRGTQNWMAPEILKIMTEENDRKTTTTTTSMPRRGTVKSDVFSAGLVFGYYLLDGDHPFGSPFNVLPNIVKNKPVNLTKMKLHPMHAIIMEMLKDNPDERISSADVVSGLNNLIELQVSLSISIDRKKVLGKGAYGIVYEGTWKNSKVAVKRIQIEKVQNNKEEEALQKLYHPNVVKLLHVESDSDFRYYALELCQASLDHKFLDETNPKKYRGLMPPEKEVCLQLAKGLAHIHDKGLIHRDIKPENVLIWVDYTGEKVVMKWSGFGLSKQVDERGSYSISGMRGTDNWMAPEILKIMMEEENDLTTTTTCFDNMPRRGTVKSDVFSAGLVFGYYLLGGHHPFGSGYDIWTNIFKNEPVNLTEIKEHPMRAIIMDMLKDNPNERISSANVVSRIKSII